jgi:hypothetical protein
MKYPYRLELDGAQQMLECSSDLTSLSAWEKRHQLENQ